MHPNVSLLLLLWTVFPPLYMLPMGKIICKDGVCFHGYAKDTQVCFKQHKQSWPKVLAPVLLCQTMHRFSQIFVAITNALVLSCLFHLLALKEHKKAEGTQNFKNGLDKTIGPSSEL